MKSKQLTKQCNHKATAPQCKSQKEVRAKEEEKKRPPAGELQGIQKQKHPKNILNMLTRHCKNIQKMMRKSFDR